ncbi:MAG: hypothetical protein IPG34_10120 [Rhodocyclaceae bacterium]|nr:hypothetical protein [Rhodocyclaceae bacterium]
MTKEVANMAVSAALETAFCYHCRTHHPVEEMRQIATRSGKRWRCIRSIEATQGDRAKRDAFGKSITAMHQAEADDRARTFLHPLPHR